MAWVHSFGVTNNNQICNQGGLFATLKSTLKGLILDADKIITDRNLMLLKNTFSRSFLTSNSSIAQRKHL